MFNHPVLVWSWMEEDINRTLGFIDAVRFGGNMGHGRPPFVQSLMACLFSDLTSLSAS